MTAVKYRVFGDGNPDSVPISFQFLCLVLCTSCGQHVQNTSLALLIQSFCKLCCPNPALPCPVLLRASLHLLALHLDWLACPKASALPYLALPYLTLPYLTLPYTRHALPRPDLPCPT